MSQIVTYCSKPPERVFFCGCFSFFLKKNQTKGTEQDAGKMDILELTKI